MDTAFQTLVDLADDFAEIAYLAGSGRHKLVAYLALVDRHEIAYPPTTTLFVRQHAQQLCTAYDNIRQMAETAFGAHAAWQQTDIPALIVQKKNAYSMLRTLHCLGGAAATAAEWQSPSFLHALTSQAGKHTNAITGTVNDYQRDHHQDGRAYEQAFRAAYVDAKGTPGVLVCTSGMAAFTTIIAALHIEGKLDGNIVAGQSTYFECKEVLRDFCKGRVTFVDETNAEAVTAAVRTLAPSAIFLDALCNVESIAVPNLSALIPALARTVKKPTTLVVDTTGLGPSYQPLHDLPRGTHLGLVTFGSLNKYHQFGFDGVTGGIIVRDHATTLNLYRARMHLGTNIADTSVLSLPTPNRDVLARRMARLNRNATYLATRLDTHYSTHRHLLLSHVVYPGLPSHPSYAWVQHLSFHGSFLTLAFRSLARFPIVYQAWLRLVIAEAKHAGVDIVAGTSFGFSATRVYLTARHASRSTTPFLRIAVGTETREEMKKIADALIRATDRLSL